MVTISLSESVGIKTIIVLNRGFRGIPLRDFYYIVYYFSDFETLFVTINLKSNLRLTDTDIKNGTLGMVY